MKSAREKSVSPTRNRTLISGRRPSPPSLLLFKKEKKKKAARRSTESSHTAPTSARHPKTGEKYKTTTTCNTKQQTIFFVVVVVVYSIDVIIIPFGPHSAACDLLWSVSSGTSQIKKEETLYRQEAPSHLAASACEQQEVQKRSNVGT